MRKQITNLLFQSWTFKAENVYWRTVKAIRPPYSKVFFLREQISLFVSRGQTMPLTHLCLLLLLSKEFRHLIKWRGGILMMSRRGFQGYKIYSKSCYLVNLLSSSTITGYGNSSEQYKGWILDPDVAVAAQKPSLYANVPFQSIELCGEISMWNVDKNVRT